MDSLHLVQKNKTIIDVLLAVIKDAQGRYLIAQRKDPCKYAGYWEFPGGKRDAGESRLQALQRESREELAIDVKQARPLFQWSYQYPDRHVRLDAWLVQQYEGEPHGAEGQQLQWVPFDAFAGINFLEANKVMMKVLALPDCYAITPEFDQTADFYSELDTLLSQNIRLLQFRAKQMTTPVYQQHAERIAKLCLAKQVAPLFNADIDFVKSIPGAGLHIDSARLMKLSKRPIESDRWLSVSCHNKEELLQAEKIDADMILLSPVLPTSTHAHGPTLGWQRLEEFVREVNIPVYALGGLSKEDVTKAHLAGCQGVASISAFWPIVSA